MLLPCYRSGTYAAPRDCQQLAYTEQAKSQAHFLLLTSLQAPQHICYGLSVKLWTSLLFVLQQPYAQDCWQMDRAACEHLLLSNTQLLPPPPPQPTQPATAAAAAPLFGASSSAHLQSLLEGSASLGLEGAFPDFSHSGRSDASAFREEVVTDVPDSQMCLPAVGASSCQEYWYEGPQGVSHGSSDLLQLSYAPGGQKNTLCILASLFTSISI